MKKQPSAVLQPAEVREALNAVNIKALERVAQASGVTIHTLKKIRLGHTIDPGLGTVGKLWPHLQAEIADAERIAKTTAQRKEQIARIQKDINDLQKQSGPPVAPSKPDDFEDIHY